MKYGKQGRGVFEREGVAPLAGAWIEIRLTSKYFKPTLVAPLAGAWIEIEKGISHIDEKKVAPLAGAWIEISIRRDEPGAPSMSLPSRERGLK